MLQIPIVIPAYEPDENLLLFCESLRKVTNRAIIIVNDGSDKKYNEIFDTAKKNYCCTVLQHDINRGKGRALKSAFEYILNEFEDVCGCVTADSDGQHSPKDVLKCIEALEGNPHNLILGCRNFNLESIPFKSRFGNKLTKFICKYFCGINITDTQTGLRAIPKAFMSDLLNIPGERFEFETNMLIEARNKYPFLEVEIETIYESKTEHKTHFNPVKDSFKIYAAIFKNFFRYAISSFSASIIDVCLFTVFCSLLRPIGFIYYITLATVLARIISSVYNYIINYSFVFRSKNKRNITIIKYFSLCLIQMILSSVLTTIGVFLLPMVWESAVKIIVDIILFVISYNIQKKFIF